MKIITESVFLHVEHIESIIVAWQEGTTPDLLGRLFGDKPTDGKWVLTMKYKGEDGEDRVFTSKHPDQQRVLDQHKEIIKQIRMQDNSFVDEAFDKAILGG